MKKNIFITFLFLLIFCGINVSAETYGNLTYTVSNDEEVTITDCNITVSGEFVIPSVIAGYPVTCIGEEAFYKCSKLTSITIPDSITRIGRSAFDGCSGLTDVYITDIALWCEICFDNSLSNPLTRASNLYLNDILVTDLIIPTGVTGVKNYAFYNYKKLNSVTIAEGADSIGSSSFEGCNNLTTITIPLGVTNIGNSAFSGCSRLENLIIPDSVTNIDSSAFFRCTSLDCVIIPDSVTHIGSYAFNGCSGLKTITIPCGIKLIGGYAFYNCSSLATVYMPVSASTSYDFGDTVSVIYVDAKLMPLSVTRNGNKYIYKICVDGYCELDDKLIICLFNDDDKLIAFKTHCIDEKVEYTLEDTLISDVPATNYKLFMWEDLTSIKPIAVSVNGIIE